MCGVEMFINQAVLQFELWTAKRAPVELMRKIVLKKKQMKKLWEILRSLRKI